jgi:hypothetical protein
MRTWFTRVIAGLMAPAALPVEPMAYDCARFWRQRHHWQGGAAFDTITATFTGRGNRDVECHLTLTAIVPIG